MPDLADCTKEQLLPLATAFDALPPRCRAVLWLRRVEEFSQQEVARKLGLTEKAVETALARGLELLVRAGDID
jgi:RNA polymerase sigma factor (sigma-70 family)